MERGGARLASSERNLRRRTVRRRGAASSKGFDDEIQGVPPFASCSPYTSLQNLAKIF